MASLEAPVTTELLGPLRARLPKYFKDLPSVCNHAIAELRGFQALTHAGVLARIGQTEQWVSPVFAADAETIEDLWDEQIIEAMGRDKTSECMACDLGAESSFTEGLVAEVETAGGSMIVVVISFKECEDLSPEEMAEACLANASLGFKKGDDPTCGAYAFYCLTVDYAVPQEGSDAEDEDEAETTDDEEDEDDEEYVPSEDGEVAAEGPPRAKRPRAA